MTFTYEDMQYLYGKKFSNGYRLLLHDNKFISRLDCLMNVTKGKRVLHIGCCDHIPLITKKIENKTWLHGLLLDNCSFVAGLDINKHAVEYVTKNISPPSTQMLNGIIYYSDITDAIPEQLKDTDFDFAVMGEIVEHVNDPVSFLKKAKKNLEKSVERIIITVPNALRFRNYQSVFQKKRYTECINTDHRYWFTPFTIAKVCIEAGIYPEELLFCDQHYTVANRIARKLRFKNFYKNSVFSDTIVLIGSLMKKDRMS